MPNYVYMCPEGSEYEIHEPMVAAEKHYCARCGKEMWRKPQPVRVTWGGLKPSDGELHPEIQHLVDTEDERRAEYLMKKENYEKEKDQ